MFEVFLYFYFYVFISLSLFCSPKNVSNIHLLDKWRLIYNGSFYSPSLSLFFDDATTQRRTLSPASTLKEAMTWSAVSVSAVSRDMKSMKAWKVTMPIRLGSTMLMMRENSFSPWWQQRGTMKLCRCSDSSHGNTVKHTANDRHSAYRAVTWDN